MAYATTTTTASVPTDTLANTFALSKSLTGLGSTVGFNIYVYAATESAASGADTITLHLTAAPTYVYLTCWEGVGVSTTLRTSQTGSGTYTSGSSVTLSTASLTPTSGDLEYAFAAYQPCAASGAPAYTSGWTSMTARGTDFSGATTCRSQGAHTYDVNAMDEYVLPGSASTASIGSGTWGSAVNTGTWGWGEVQLDYEAAAQNIVLSATGTASVSGTMAQGSSPATATGTASVTGVFAQALGESPTGTVSVLSNAATTVVLSLAATGTEMLTGTMSQAVGESFTGSASLLGPATFSLLLDFTGTVGVTGIFSQLVGFGASGDSSVLGDFSVATTTAGSTTSTTTSTTNNGGGIGVAPTQSPANSPVSPVWANDPILVNPYYLAAIFAAIAVFSKHKYARRIVAFLAVASAIATYLSNEPTPALILVAVGVYAWMESRKRKH